MISVTRALRAAGLTLALGLLAGCAAQPKDFASERFEEGKTAYLAGDYSNAFELLLGEAEQGNPEAQYTIGYMYYLGQGVREDEAAARRGIQRSAAAGNQRAVEALGHLAGMGGARQRARQQHDTSEPPDQRD